MQLMAEARALRARDRSHAALISSRPPVLAPPQVTALMRLPEPR
jgi:hypothetical protein